MWQRMTIWPGERRVMRAALCGVLILLVASGCSKKSSLLLERFAKGPLADTLSVAQPIQWELTPVVQEKTQGQVKVMVNYASSEYRKNFFNNKDVFGGFAGRDPYYPEHFVFYVEVTNHSSQKIEISPREFKLVDDRGNQLRTIGVDYVTAYAEFRQPVSTTTRGVVQGARPGYFGLSLPVGNLARRSPWRFALLKQSGLQSGYLFPGVVHDGLIAFWNPSRHATKLSLFITNIKAKFDAQDKPQQSFEYTFVFDASHP